MTNPPVPIVRLDVVDSTNDEARRLLARGDQSIVCVVAREQRAGRGTRGRAWSSPRDAGLYLSLGVRPTPAPPTTALHTPAAGVAAAEAIEQTTGTRIALKPVNDLVVGDRKLGGILTEGIVERQRLESFVVGVGMNLVPSTWPGAISLAEIVSPSTIIDREQLLVTLVERLTVWCERASQGEDDQIRHAWLAFALDGAAFPTAVG